MNFKELLRKYQDGEATEEEKKLVKAEIDKYEAIEDYLMDNISLPLNGKINSEQEIHDYQKNKEKGEINEILNINKAINQRLRKVVLASVVIVILIYTSIFYVVSPTVSRFYYNPSKVTMGEYLPDFVLDLRAVTELNSPGYSMLGFRHIDPKGFGVYSINHFVHDLFTREVNTRTLEIRRGEHYGYVENVNDSAFGIRSRFAPVANYSLRERGFFEGQVERITEHLEALNPVSYVSAYITFEEDLALEELVSLQQSNQDLVFQWVGVRTHDKHKIPKERPNHLTGFNPIFSDGSDSADKPDPSKYPFFNLIDHLEKGRGNTVEAWAETYAQHYRSLLSYVIDRGEDIEALEFYPNKVEYYKDALEYIDENGINIFGALVYGEARDLLPFINEHGIISIEIERVIPSKPFIR